MSLRIVNTQDRAYRIHCGFPYSITPVPGAFGPLPPVDMLASGDCIEFNTTADIVVELTNDVLYIKVGRGLALIDHSALS